MVRASGLESFGGKCPLTEWLILDELILHQFSIYNYLLLCESQKLIDDGGSYWNDLYKPKFATKCFTNKTEHDTEISRGQLTSSKMFSVFIGKLIILGGLSSLRGIQAIT